MGPKNRATNWPYNRFGTISDGTIALVHVLADVADQPLYILFSSTVLRHIET